VFVNDIAAMPQAIVDAVRDDDVVLCMGAGSIGTVSAKVLGLLQHSELPAQQARAL
jgi:UDP-N-acetylmuramate--alanine ligase